MLFTKRLLTASFLVLGLSVTSPGVAENETATPPPPAPPTLHNMGQDIDATLTALNEAVIRGQEDLQRLAETLRTVLPKDAPMSENLILKAEEASTANLDVATLLTRLETHLKNDVKPAAANAIRMLAKDLSLLQASMNGRFRTLESAIVRIKNNTDLSQNQDGVNRHLSEAVTSLSSAFESSSQALENLASKMTDIRTRLDEELDSLRKSDEGFDSRIETLRGEIAGIIADFQANKAADEKQGSSISLLETTVAELARASAETGKALSVLDEMTKNGATRDEALQRIDDALYSLDRFQDVLAQRIGHLEKSGPPEMAESLRALGETTADMNAALAGFRSKLDKLESKVGENRFSQRQIEQRNTELAASIENLGTNFEQTRQAVSDREELAETIDKIRKMHEDALLTLGTLQGTIAALSSRVDAIATDLQAGAKADDLDALVVRVDTAETRLAGLEKDRVSVQVLETRLAETATGTADNAEVERLDDVLTETRAKISGPGGLEASLSTLESQLAAALEKITDKTEIESLSKEIAAGLQKLEELETGKASIAILESRLTEARNGSADKAEVEKLAEELANLRDRMDSLDTHKASVGVLENRLAETTAALNRNIEARLAENAAKPAVTADEMTTLQRKLDAIGTDVDALLARGYLQPSESTLDSLERDARLDEIVEMIDARRREFEAKIAEMAKTFLQDNTKTTETREFRIRMTDSGAPSVDLKPIDATIDELTGKIARIDDIALRQDEHGRDIAGLTSMLTELRMAGPNIVLLREDLDRLSEKIGNDPRAGEKSREDLEKQLSKLAIRVEAQETRLTAFDTTHEAMVSLAARMAEAERRLKDMEKQKQKPQVQALSQETPAPVARPTQLKQGWIAGIAPRMGSVSNRPIDIIGQFIARKPGYSLDSFKAEGNIQFLGDTIWTGDGFYVVETKGRHTWVTTFRGQPESKGQTECSLTLNIGNRPLIRDSFSGNLGPQALAQSFVGGIDLDPGTYPVSFWYACTGEGAGPSPLDARRVVVELSVKGPRDASLQPFGDALRYRPENVPLGIPVSSGTAQAPAPAAPNAALRVDPLDITLRTAVNANVRSTPSEEGNLVATLNEGTYVKIVGKVAGSSWYQVLSRDGQHVAYMHENLFETAGNTPAAAPQPPAAKPAATPPRVGECRTYETYRDFGNGRTLVKGRACFTSKGIWEREGDEVPVSSGAASDGGFAAGEADILR